MRTVLPCGLDLTYLDFAECISCLVRVGVIYIEALMG